MNEKQKRKHRFFKSIRSRMIVGFLVVFLAAAAFMGAGIYLFTVDLLERKNQKSYENILNSAENVLDDKLDVNIRTARWLLGNETVQEVLIRQDDSEGVYMSQERLNALNAVCREYIYNVEGVEGLYFFDNQGKFYYEDLDRSGYEVEEAVNYGELEGFDWYQEALLAKGREIFLGYDVITGRPDRISCVKAMNRLNSTEKIGLLVLSISRDTMKNVIGQFPTERDVYVMECRGSIVYENGYSKEQFGAELKTVLANWEKEYLVTEHVCRAEGWRLLHAVRRSDVFGEASAVRAIIMVIAAVAAAGMVFLCFLEARRIVKPLERLKEDIERVGEGKRSFSHTFGDDEVGAIGRSFQTMVKERLELKERAEREELLRKDSELQLLQSQIKPHFLYNTLDTLYWMAISEGAEQSAELTQALSEIFKISLSEGREWIAVRDEMKFIEDYLYIQNVRFADKFLVKLQVEEEIRETPIIKQVIQPFVENAIYHGLEPKLGKGNLIVSGKSEAGFLVFTVQDDGVGIEEGKDVWKGYAVSNVLKRLKLHYGKKAELCFESRQGEGTTVTIRIPRKEEKNAEDRFDR